MQTSVSVKIRATPEKIHAILTNAEKFSEWNSNVQSIQGSIRKGNTIKLKSTLSPERTFKLKVTELTPLTMVWEDGFAPVFRGRRAFSLVANSDHSTEFHMTEVFKGLILPLIKGSLPDFRPNFDQYAADLKKAAEAV